MNSLKRRITIFSALKVKRKKMTSKYPLFLDSLAEKNPHIRDAQIKFRERDHKYWLNDDDTGLISTTTLLKKYFSEFDASFAIKNIMKSQRYFDDEEYIYYRLNSEQIKSIWNTIGSNAARNGTYYHLQIEKYYNGEVADFTNDLLHGCFRQFDRDITARGYIPFRTEMLMFHNEAKITGSADMLFQHRETKKLLLVDWKFIKKLAMTSKTKAKETLSHLDDTTLVKYSMQLSVYRYILETEYSYEFETENNLLVVFNPEKKVYREVEATYLRDEAHCLIMERILENLN